MPLLGLALLALAAVAVLPSQAAAQTPPPGPCDAGWVAPTPTSVAVTDVPITVSSTSADYFVLYVQVDNVRGVTKGLTPTSSIPISVTLGVDGTTTLSDSLAPLSANRYRVEKYLVAQPGDIDGDCVDDLTELADLGTYNPISAAKTIDMVNGAIVIDSLETFQELSYDGGTKYPHYGHMQGLEFIKFSILNVETDNPITYFINTNTTVSHGTFGEAIDLTIPEGSLFTRGEIVYHPNVKAPDGSLGIYRFNFDGFERGGFRNIAKFNEILAAAMPLLENDLFYYPVTNGQLGAYQQEKAQFDASRINVLKAEDINADVDFTPLNQAEGYGRLRLMEDDDRPSPFDVAIYTTLPNDLPRVAGTITTVQQTPLSHVNLRAIQNGLPNAFIRDALDDDAITSLIDGYVYYAVTAEGYTIRAATKKEVDDHHESLRPATTQTLQRDLTVTAITSLSNVNFADWTAFGVKAANVAELTKLSLPDGTTPVGFAVPFYFYDEFMKQATLGEETILGKKKAPDEEKITLAAGTTLAAAVTAMLAHAHFQTDADIQEEMLDDLRDAIKDATSPAWITKALEDMHAIYPDGQSLRYRSSTNNEDLPSFNGAGLYSSKTQDPNETTDDGIDKSIKQVWASLWNYRAFLERDFHRVDHTTVAMGVLVHPNYSDEPVNGVAVSYDPITFQDSAYYVNSQMGEDLVTNPEANSQPEQLLLGSTGAPTVLSRSNLVTSDNLLMTAAQMRQLRSNLETIHNRFKTLYGVLDGDDFAIEIEFKITAANKLAIKQARPWIFPEPLVLTPPTVTIALDATQATEGAGFELTATREGGILSQPLAVELTWSETGAMLQSARPASVTIPVNQTAATIAVPIDDDQEDEHDSDITVTIAANSDYTIGTPNSATATVTDDDLTNIAVRADAGTVTEGAAAGFTFTRSGSVLEQPLTVGITFSETGSRLPGGLPTDVTFAANSAAATVSFTTVDDAVWTGRSVITVQIDAGSGYGIAGAGRAQVTVVDDELQPPTMDFDFNHAPATGRNYALTIEASRPKGTMSFALSGPDTNVFVDYTFANILLFQPQRYDQPADANQDGVYEVDLTATDSLAGSTTVRLRFTVVTDEFVALTAQQWNQLSQDDRVALLPDVGSARLRPAFASLHSDVQAQALRLGRQGQLPMPGPTVSIAADGDITEGSDATFTVSADPAPTVPLSVTVAVSQTGDFGVAPASHTVTIPTSGSAPFSVTTTDDSLHEADGSVTATVGRDNGYVVSWPAGAATVAVADDDPAPLVTPEISIASDGDITEGGNATFTLTANPAPTGVLAVTVTVTASGDYGVTPASHTVTISTGGTGTFTLITTDDSADEADGSITATISDGTDYDVSATAGAATVAVADDDAPPPTTPVISIAADGDITEGGDATFTLTASPAPTAPLDVTVSVTTSGDYGVTPASHTVTISTVGTDTLTITTSGDSTDEPNGSVTATIADGTNYDVSATADAATVAVADDDDAPPPPPTTPVISIASDGDVTEGGDATFTLTANPTPRAPLDVSVGVTQTGDFGVTPGSQTVTIPTTGTGTLTVSTDDDGVDEADGSVTATVNSGSGYTVSATAGTGAVVVSDDDATSCTPNLPSDAVTVSEVTGWRDGHSGADHVLRWNRVLEALGEDTGSGATPMTVTESEANESTFMASRWDRVTRTLEAIEACDDGGTTTTVVPPPPTPEVSIAADGDITEGGNATFTLTANPAPSANLDVDVSVTQTGDFGVTPGSRTVTIGTGGTGTLTLTTDDDSVDEPDGSVTATITDGTDYDVSAAAGAATAVVSDDDAAPPPACTPNLPSDAVAVSEVTGWRDAHDHDTDHVLRWNRVLEALGEDTGTGATAMTAAESEANESTFMASRWDRVTRTLEAIETCDTTTTTVVPPPPTPEVSIASDGDITEGGSATFTLTANPAPSSALTVTVTVTQSGDYGVTPGSQTVTISTSGTGTLTLTTDDDNVDEPNGSVTATITDGTDYDVSATAGVATVVVSDDDDAPPVTCTPNLPSDAVTVAEVTGWRDGHSGAAHVLRWNRVLEALGEDTGSGATPMTATQSEANESTFMFSRWDRVTRTLEAIEACDTTTTTVVPPPPTPEVSIASGGDITEGGSATFTLSASPAPSSALTVTVGVTQSGDFGVTTGSHTVTISTGGTGTLTIATIDDSVDEADGSVTATVTDGTDYDVSATAGAATVAVSDDDTTTVVPPPPATPVVSIASDGDITEGGDATFTLTANPTPSSPLDVTVSVTQSGDFGVTTGSRTVTIGTDGSGTLTVSTIDDSADEADGSVTVTIDDGAAYDVSTTAGAATAAVADDDPAATRLPPSQVSFAVEDASATEGETLRARVTLSNAATRQVRVWWRTRYGGGEDRAFPGRDYPELSGWLSFAPGDTEQWVEIPLPDDASSEPSEVFQVYLGFTEGGATIADRDGVMTIVDND